MELRALVNVDNAVCRGLAVPDRVLEEALDPVEDDLEDAEAAAESLPGEEVSLAGDLRLLGRAQLLDVGDHLQGRVSREQTFKRDDQMLRIQSYLASSLFCLVSGFSPSLQKGLGRIFWKGAACSRSHTSS